MAHKLDIGVVSYKAPDKLQRTLASIRETAQSDFRCFVIHNPTPDDNPTREVVCRFAAADPRFVPVWMAENVGYAGGVNKLLELAETEFVAYSDNDVMHRTPGWDEQMIVRMGQFHEIGMLFPGDQPGMIDRGNYKECLWGIGCSWMMSRLCQQGVKERDLKHGTSAVPGGMDTAIGHQNECDLALRVRMAGWKCACLPQITIQHECSASTDGASQARIGQGVYEFVCKWCSYFGGKNLNYNSTNVLRWDDWPPNALYLEEYWQQKHPALNANPEVVKDGYFEYDLIRVPRRSGYYRNRII